MKKYFFTIIELVVVVVLYLTYLVFDVVTNVVHKNTYENEYMKICEEYRRQEEEKAVAKKLKEYKKKN